MNQTPANMEFTELLAALGIGALAFGIAWLAAISYAAFLQ